MDVKSKKPTLKFLIKTKYVSFDDPSREKLLKDPEEKSQKVENKSVVSTNGKILEDSTDEVQSFSTTLPNSLDTKNPTPNPYIKHNEVQEKSMVSSDEQSTENSKDGLQSSANIAVIFAHEPSPNLEINQQVQYKKIATDDKQSSSQIPPTLPVAFTHPPSPEIRNSSRKSSKSSSPEIQSKRKTFSSILSDITSVCEKQVFGQTSLVQNILNACSKLMNLPGSDELCNDINSACNEILTETYQNSHVIIDLCEDLFNIKLGNMKEPSKSNPSVTNFSASAKNSQPNATISNPNEVTLSSHAQEALSSDSDQKGDDSDMISDKDEDDGNMDSDDPDWEPELEEKPKYKNNKSKILKKNSGPQEDTVYGDFPCLKCPKILTTLRGYENHQYLKHTKVTCEICSAQILGGSIYTHMKMHSGEKTVICDICGAAFLDKSSLNSHKFVHIDERPFKCERCDHTCKNRKMLTRHMVCHSSVRKYQCEECGICFARTNELKFHRLIHKDVWPFSCTTCGKKFKTKYRLSRHENIHTNTFLHECKVCGKKIRQQGNLKIHMRTHNGEKPYKCEICGLGFAHNVTRKQHQLSCGK